MVFWRWPHHDVSDRPEDCFNGEEFGVVRGLSGQRLIPFKKLELPRALNDERNDSSPVMRRLVGDLFADLRRLEERIREVTKEIEAVADREDVTCRLMTIPGIGALGATAVLAAIRIMGVVHPNRTTIQSQFPTAMA
ncbi:hypothetical protein [Bradyrhizobium yuanmingense]|uniref:hypothetical protein n=1 Tax=Bradyrhizobium yuanmingense TaxID=108015 RepID=UPI001F0B434B|nr:hypothetical protein [Bradyrhizobium yuanmingense]